jgi:rod shape-determining protein MreD
MKILFWVIVAWFLSLVSTSVALYVSPSYILPELPIIVVVYLSLHYPLAHVSLAALALGFTIGSQSGSVLGLHEAALAVSGMIVHLSSGRLAGHGPFFFALITGATTIGYHLSLMLMMTVAQQKVGFASVWTALLAPNAIATSICAFILYSPFLAIDKSLSPQRSEVLSWD